MQAAAAEHTVGTSVDSNLLITLYDTNFQLTIKFKFLH